MTFKFFAFAFFLLGPRSETLFLEMPVPLNFLKPGLDLALALSSVHIMQAWILFESKLEGITQSSKPEPISTSLDLIPLSSSGNPDDDHTSHSIPDCELIVYKDWADGEFQSLLCKSRLQS